MFYVVMILNFHFPDFYQCAHENWKEIANLSQYFQENPGLGVKNKISLLWKWVPFNFLGFNLDDKNILILLLPVVVIIIIATE